MARSPGWAGFVAEMPGLDLRWVCSSAAKAPPRIATPSPCGCSPTAGPLKLLLADFSADARPPVEAVRTVSRRRARVLPGWDESHWITSPSMRRSTTLRHGRIPARLRAAVLLLSSMAAAGSERGGRSTRSTSAACRCPLGSSGPAAKRIGTLLWKGRKSAFAAVGRITPTYTLQDGWFRAVPYRPVLAAMKA